MTRKLRFALTSFAVGLAGLPLISCASQIPAGNSPTQLEIIIRAAGTEITEQYTLDCSDSETMAASTLPDASKACALLAEDPSALTTPIDPQEICTEIYGGPQRAAVQGTLSGSAVSTEFSRHNGCAIERWDAAAFLIGSGNS